MRSSSSSVELSPLMQEIGAACQLRVVAMQRLSSSSTVAAAVYSCNHKEAVTPADAPSEARSLTLKVVYVERCSDKARATAAVVREIELLKQLRGHAHIVQLERVHTSPCGGRIYLVIEHLPTTLAMLMAEDPGVGLPLEQMHGICRQALIALRYLHARDIGHHGLSPSNILFTPGYGNAKLSDFASAGLPGDLAAGFAHWYRAPEQFVGAPVGCEADVWALGCVLFEMAAGAPLLPGNSDDEQLTLMERIVGALPARFQLGRRAAAAGASAGSSSAAASTHERSGCAVDMLYARGVHPDLADVVAACLEVDPLKRASVRDLLLMPLFQGDERGHCAATSATTHATAPLPHAKSFRAAPQLLCAETAHVPCVPSAHSDSALAWSGESRRRRPASMDKSDAEASLRIASLSYVPIVASGGGDKVIRSNLLRLGAHSFRRRDSSSSTSSASNGTPSHLTLPSGIGFTGAWCLDAREMLDAHAAARRSRSPSSRRAGVAGQASRQLVDCVPPSRASAVGLPSRLSVDTSRAPPKGGKAASDASTPLIVIGSLGRSPTRVSTLSWADGSFDGSLKTADGVCLTSSMPDIAAHASPLVDERLGGSLTTGDGVCLTSSMPDIAAHASPLAVVCFGSSLTTGDGVCLTSSMPDILAHASPLARSLPEETNAVGLTSSMPDIAALVHPPPEEAGVGSTSTRSAANFAQLGSCNDSFSAKQQLARVRAPPGTREEEQQQQVQQVQQHGPTAPQPARERKEERSSVRHMLRALTSLRSSWRGALLKVTSALGSGGDGGSTVDAGGGGGCDMSGRQQQR